MGFIFILVQMPLALSAFMLVMSHQPNLSIEAMTKSRQIEALTGRPNEVKAQEASGYTDCKYSKVVKIGFMAGSRNAVEHELLHAVDCVDDGEFNGSPLPASVGTCHPAVTDCAHKWVYWAQAHKVEAQAIIEKMLAARG